jgi:hypothetical protein
MTETLWPPLPLEEWQDTYATLHMWTQIVGKIRLQQTPLVNHWWNVPLYVTARGLTTSTMPYKDHSFEMEFDFLDHQLLIKRDDRDIETLDLIPRSVADFYREVFQRLRALQIDVKIWPVPVEVEKPVPFEQDHQNASYDREYANRFWRILVQTEKVFTRFRAGYIGKCSPVHFFWGSFDLAVTRFSGRRAPQREGADPITREAYSHEVISHGFWPGTRASGTPAENRSASAIQAPAFYSYTAPAPAGLSEQMVRPRQAFYSTAMQEFILLYDDVRKAESPEIGLMEFLESTYEAGANLAHWDRAELERSASR